MTTKQKQTPGKERETAVIRAPHDGSEVGVVSLAGPEQVRAALDANVAAARACRILPAYERAAALRKVADGLVAGREDLARTLALEAGKPIAQARIELDRAPTKSRPRWRAVRRLPSSRRRRTLSRPCGSRSS